MSKNPAIQARVRAEVDAMYAQLEKEKREMAYDDLQKFPFLSRVITETLRLCTFRRSPTNLSFFFLRLTESISYHDRVRLLPVLVGVSPSH